MSLKGSVSTLVNKHGWSKFIKAVCDVADDDDSLSDEAYEELLECNDLLEDGEGDDEGDEEEEKD